MTADSVHEAQERGELDLDILEEGVRAMQRMQHWVHGSMGFPKVPDLSGLIGPMPLKRKLVYTKETERHPLGEQGIQDFRDTRQSGTEGAGKPTDSYYTEEERRRYWAPHSTQNEKCQELPLQAKLFATREGPVEAPQSKPRSPAKQRTPSESLAQKNAT